MYAYHNILAYKEKLYIYKTKRKIDRCIIYIIFLSNEIVLILLLSIVIHYQTNNVNNDDNLKWSDLSHPQLEILSQAQKDMHLSFQGDLRSPKQWDSISI